MSQPKHLPPDGEPFDRPDYKCASGCLVSGQCCKNCSVCAGPYCFPACIFRKCVSLSKVRYVDKDFNLDLLYLTPRIIAHGFPAVGPEVMWRNPRSELLRFFSTRHPDAYRIYNLTVEMGRVYGCHEFGGRCRLFPFLDKSVPTLGMMVDFVADAAAFLQEDPSNVVGIHCKAGKGRTGLMACCLLLGTGVYATAEEALAHYDKVRVTKGIGLTSPSQRRFVRYYAKLLSEGVRDSSQMVEPTRRLVSVALHSYPGQSPAPHDLTLTIHTGLDRDLLVHEGVLTGPDSVFPCNADVTGNVYVEAHNNGKCIASAWVNTRFVGEPENSSEAAPDVKGEQLETDAPTQSVYNGNSIVLSKYELEDFRKDRAHKLAPAAYKLVLQFAPVEAPVSLEGVTVTDTPLPLASPGPAALAVAPVAVAHVAAAEEKAVETTDLDAVAAEAVSLQPA